MGLSQIGKRECNEVLGSGFKKRKGLVVVYDLDNKANFWVNKCNKWVLLYWRTSYKCYFADSKYALCKNHIKNEGTVLEFVNGFENLAEPLRGGSVNPTRKEVNFTLCNVIT